MSMYIRLHRLSWPPAIVSLISCASAPVDDPWAVRPFTPPEINYELIPADVPPPSVSWEDPIDFGELRELYGRRRDFGERCEHPPQKEQALAAVRANEIDRVLELSDSLLARCPVDPLLHHWRATALSAAGFEEDARVHEKWVEGLFESILSTGNGRTSETPFFTISIYEEYEVLSYLGLTRKSQALVGDSTALDAIVAERADGSEVTVYFNPALHFVRLYESLK